MKKFLPLIGGLIAVLGLVGGGGMWAASVTGRVSANERAMVKHEKEQKSDMKEVLIELKKLNVNQTVIITMLGKGEFK